MEDKSKKKEREKQIERGMKYVGKKEDVFRRETSERRRGQ